jgi:hypothetical protein
MADEKVTYLQVVKPRRPIEVRDLALAAFYPRTKSTTSIPAVTPDVQSLQKRQRDDPSPPENVAKPWKKPWEK